MESNRTIDEAYGSRIRKVRKAMGLSQIEFGHRIGVGRDTIANLENSRTILQSIHIKSICREFGVNYEWLAYGGDDEDMFIRPDAAIHAAFRIAMNNDSDDRYEQIRRQLFILAGSLTREEIACLDGIVTRFLDGLPDREREN